MTMASMTKSPSIIIPEHHLSKRRSLQTPRSPNPAFPDCYSSYPEHSHLFFPDEYDLELSDVDSEFVALSRVPLTLQGTDVFARRDRVGSDSGSEDDSTDDKEEPETA